MDKIVLEKPPESRTRTRDDDEDEGFSCLHE
jgi:hypothetical protein